MKKISFFLIAALFFELTGISKNYEGQRSTHLIIEKSTGDSISFDVYLPPGYDTVSKKLPCAIWLHGLGGNYKGADIVLEEYEKYLKHGIINMMVFIFPNGYTNAMWANSKDGKKTPENEVIKEIIPYAEKNLKISKKRDNRIVIGFSMGGFGAIEYGLKFPDVFSIAVNLDGAMHNWESIQGRSQLVDEIFEGDENYWDLFSPYNNAVKYSWQTKYNVAFKTVVGQLVEYNDRFKKLADSLGILMEYSKTPCAHNLNCVLSEQGKEIFQFIDFHLENRVKN